MHTGTAFTAPTLPAHSTRPGGLARVHPDVQPHLPQALCVEILGYGYVLWRSGHVRNPVRLEHQASAPAQACRALHSQRRVARFRRRAAACPPAHDRSSPPQMHGVGPEMTRPPPTARVGSSGPARHQLGGRGSRRERRARPTPTALLSAWQAVTRGSGWTRRPTYLLFFGRRHAHGRRGRPRGAFAAARCACGPRSPRHWPPGMDLGQSLSGEKRNG